MAARRLLSSRPERPWTRSAVPLVTLSLLLGCGQEPSVTSTAQVATSAREVPDESTSSFVAPIATTGRTSARENPDGWPPIEFEPPVLDFGVVEPGAAGQGKVKIWNAGSTPLRILRSVTSCGCTEAEDLGGRVISPGQFTEFSTTMTMKSGLGEKKEKVSILFEGYEQTFVPYFFQAEVSLPIRIAPPHITAITTLTGELVAESRDGQPFRVLAVNGHAPEFVDFDPGRDSPRNRYTLRWDLTELDEQGNIPWFWVIETDRADSPLIDVRVRHDATRPDRPKGRPWVPKDQRVVLGVVRPDSPVEVTAKIEYAGNISPQANTAAISQTPDQPFDAELIEAVPHGQFLEYRIRITPRVGEPGLLYGLLTLHASNFTTPLRVIARLE